MCIYIYIYIYQSRTCLRKAVTKKGHHFCQPACETRPFKAVCFQIFQAGWSCSKIGASSSISNISGNVDGIISIR